MEGYLKKNFELEAKNASEDALRRWRNAVTVVKNRKRRFRSVANLDMRSQVQTTRKTIRVKLRLALIVQKAALQFLEGNVAERVKVQVVHPEVPPEVLQAGFGIDPSHLATIVGGQDYKLFKSHDCLQGIAEKVSVSLGYGVSEIDLPRRQEVYGCNRYVEKPPKSFWSFVWEALQDLTLIILMVCAVASIGVGLATEGWPKGVYDGLGILLSIFLVVTVTSMSDYRQSLQFRDLDKEKKKIDVQVTREGCRQKVSIYNLVVGDIVHLSIGDQVPADGVLIDGYNLLINESALSGESDPINVHGNKPFLLAGSKVQDGSGRMLVTAVGMRTEWGRLMMTLSEGGEDETPLQVKLNGVANVIGSIGLGFSILTFLVLLGRFLYWKAMHGELWSWTSEYALQIVNYFAIAVTIIVVAVPEGLPLAVTLSLAFAMKKLMHERALVRHLSACETMGSASCICTDKTGTLTTNHMVVDKVWVCEDIKQCKSGGDTHTVLDLAIPGEALSTLLQSLFHNTGSEVVKAKDGKNTILGTPTETALLEFALHCGGDFQSSRRDSKILKLEPFNSMKKEMSVLVSLPDGKVRAFYKGASEIIVKKCVKMMNKEGKEVPLSNVEAGLLVAVIRRFACEALRTLCLAYKDIDESSDHKNGIPEGGYTLVAIFGIKDPVRLGVKEAVKTCMDAGITVRMVTGDNIDTAKAIARECGILTPNGLAMEGSELRCKSPQQMTELIPRLQVMARSSPLDKHTLVTNLRKLGEVVAVTGDGTNDAPALHDSDIGLAMGIAGTEVAKESADVIIMDDNFSTIVNVTKWGRAVYRNIQKFVQFQLTVNVVALMVNFSSACITGSAPLTAVQLLWVNMIMDTLGALALATEPPSDELMKRPPIPRGTSFITRIMWRNIIGQSVYQLAVLGILIFDGKRILNLEGPDTAAVLNTFIFNTFVFCQVFNEINSREMEKINVFRGILNSWIFTGVMVSTIVFQAIMVECLGKFANTVPLSWQLWVLSILIGSLSLIIGVVLKFIPVEFVKQSHQVDDAYQPLASSSEESV